MEAPYLFIAIISGILLSQVFYYFPLLTLLLITGLLVFSVLRRLLHIRGLSKDHRPFTQHLLLLILLISGLLYGLYRSDRTQINEVTGKAILIKYLIKERIPVESGHLYTGKIRDITGPDKKLISLRGKDASLISRVELQEDKLYNILVRAYIRGAKNPGSFKDSKITLRLLEIKGVEDIKDSPQRWINRERKGLTEYMREHFHSSPFLASIVTGDRTALSEDIKDSFSKTGLAHILSISGTHFGLLSTFVFFLIRSIISLLPAFIIRRLTIYLTPSQVAAISSLPFLILYLFISGGSIPSIRSFIMINLFLLGLLIGRKGYWLNSLLFAALLILLWNPSTTKDISFQLSFLAVVFLGYSLRDEDKTEKKTIKPLVYLKRAFRMSLFVWLGTTPLVAYYFHYISLISPFVNVILTPAVGLILLPLTLFSSFVYIFTGYFPFESVISFLARSTLRTIEYLSSLPFSAISIGDFPMAILIILYAISMAYIVKSSLSLKSNQSGHLSTEWKLPVIYGLISMLLIIFPGLNRGFSITFLDVGQGDCTVIETTRGMTFVIDTGRSGRELESYLRLKGKDRIDALILTHADNDHSGGLLRILKRFRVNEIWDNGLLLYPKGLRTPVRRLTRGDVVEADGVEMIVMHPYEGFYSNSERGGNELSLVLEIRGEKGSSLLLTADIEAEAEEDALHLSRWLRSNAIKISHHGSRYSSSEAFLNAVSPGIAIISVGKDNPFGHPHEEVIERLKRHKIRIYRTDRDGAIKLVEGKSGFIVKTYIDSVFEKNIDIKIETELRNLKRLFEVW